MASSDLAKIFGWGAVFDFILIIVITFLYNAMPNHDLLMQQAYNETINVLGIFEIIFIGGFILPPIMEIIFGHDDDK